MRKLSRLIMLLLFLFLVQYLNAQDKSSKTMDDHIVFSQNDMKWMDAPPVFEKGSKMVVLDGDPSSKDGEFTVRLSLPANYIIAPHWHPTTENVTVIKGQLYVGMGDKLDKEAAKTLETGDFASIPALHHHYAFSKDACVIQVNAMGPFQITYVNPADDPSKHSSIKK